MTLKGNLISVAVRVFLTKFTPVFFRVLDTFTAIFFGHFLGSEGTVIMPIGRNVVVLGILFSSLIFLASAILIVGDTIVTWLWGGFSVDNATLNHLLLFILIGANLLHLAALHQYGSNNPLGVHSEMDKFSFYPYFYVKDQ